MRVLVFGDSITQGFWDTNGGWADRIKQHYMQGVIQEDDFNRHDIVNLGVSGDLSDHVASRIENEAKARGRSNLAFVIAIGVNDSQVRDGANFSDTDRYKSNLEQILKTTRQFSEKVLFVGLTPAVEERTTPVSWGDYVYTNERILEFDAVLKEFCQKNKLPYVEIFQPFQETQKTLELMQDGLHPNNEGHQLIADLVRAKLEENLR
jgi:lysophospholipase L1-like esterase